MAEKILVVDDDLDTLRLIGMMMERQGYSILTANSGVEALDLVESGHPDLILLDVMMPGMNGIEVTRRLRNAESTRDIPIIMLTAKTQLEDKLIGFEAGADDYLTKPTQPRELFAHVKAVLARTGKSRVAATSAERGFTLGILAARGGLGVSTLALNLGIALYDLVRKPVIIADFRPGQGTIGLDLGLHNPEGVSRLLQCRPSEIDLKAVETELLTYTSGLRLLLSSPQPREAQLAGAIAQFEAITSQLSLLARFVVLDLGPGLPRLTEKVLPQCDEVIVVVDPLPQIVHQTRGLMRDLNALGIGNSRIEVVVFHRIQSEFHLALNQVQEQLGHNVVASFTPAPELAYHASIQHTPLFVQQPDSPAAQQFCRLAEKLTQRSQARVIT